jgi:lipoyl synthase
MLLGSTCTRSCRFCSVSHGWQGDKVDPDEPEKVAEAARELGLGYVILTSVDRDDLNDYGAAHFSKCIRFIRKTSPSARIEAILPDLSGREDLIRSVTDAGPDVVSHNIETIERLTPFIRDRKASYSTSLAVLRLLKSSWRKPVVKSSIMLGLDETKAEVKDTLDDLRSAGVDLITIGQYLCPCDSATPVKRYVSPEEFEELGRYARSLGFKGVFSGPFVRSSYRAAAQYAMSRKVC